MEGKQQQQMGSRWEASWGRNRDKTGNKLYSAPHCTAPLCSAASGLGLGWAALRFAALQFGRLGGPWDAGSDWAGRLGAVVERFWWLSYRNWAYRLGLRLRPAGWWLVAVRPVPVHLVKKLTAASWPSLLRMGNLGRWDRLQASHDFFLFFWNFWKPARGSNL